MERIKEYIEMPQEPSAVIDNAQPPAAVTYKFTFNYFCKNCLYFLILINYSGRPMVKLKFQT